MNSLVLSQIDDIRQQMVGYTVLLSFKYVNLCVKADAMSLLPVTVSNGGREHEIEEVASVSVANDRQLLVYPRYSEMLPNIIFGIGQAHPEFKMNVKRGEMTVMPVEEAKQYREIKMGAEPEEIDQMADAEPDGDPEGLFLVYTMPDVDKERRDLLTLAVRDLHAECVERIDSVYLRRADNIATMLSNTPPQEAETLKNALERVYHDNKEHADKLRDEKLQEIDDAYAAYTLRQQQKPDDIPDDWDYSKGIQIDQIQQ